MIQMWTAEHEKNAFNRGVGIPGFTYKVIYDYHIRQLLNVLQKLSFNVKNFSLNLSCLLPIDNRVKRSE